MHKPKKCCECGWMYKLINKLIGKSLEPTGAIAKAISSAVGYTPISYTTAEQMLPDVTWIDGSPVYQISWTGTTGAALNVSNPLALTIPNMAIMVYLMGGIINNAGSHLPNNYAGAGVISFDVDVNGVLQEYHSVNNYSNAPMHVTIQYTKTN